MYRQLWMTFIFDVVELVTLGVWILFPVYMGIFWVMEKECAISGELTSTLSVSPLMACAIQARVPIIVVGAVILGLLVLVVFLFTLRFIEERRKLLRKAPCSLTSFWLFVWIIGILFILR